MRYHKDKMENPEYFMDKKYIKQVEKIMNLIMKIILTNLMEILNLKSIYLKIDDKSKENLWDIVNALLILSIQYLKL